MTEKPTAILECGWYYPAVKNEKGIERLRLGQRFLSRRAATAAAKYMLRAHPKPETKEQT